MAQPTDLDLDLQERQRLLDAWVETRRRIAALEAEAMELLVERIAIHDADVAEAPFHRDAIRRSMVSEYAAAGRVSPGSMDFAFGDARTVNDALPTVREAFRSGTIGAGHVREIVRASSVLAEAIRNGRADAAAMALFETAALVVAERDTPSRTRVHATRIAAALAGETLNERHRRAAKERGITVKSLDDGLALLTVVLPEWLVRAIVDRLTSMARRIMETRSERDPVLEPDVLDDDMIDASDLAPDDPLLDALFDAVVSAQESDGHGPSHAAAGSRTGDAIFGDGDTFTVDPFGETAAPQGRGRATERTASAGTTGDAARTTARAAGATPLIDPLVDPINSPDVEHIPADDRTLDQIRADLLTDLLLTASPGDVHGTALDSIQARVQVTIAGSTLAGDDDRPGELDGHGPLDPDVVRALAGRNGGWARLFHDAAGMLVETDTYTPSEQMKRFLRARDQHCRFPGCRMPVHRCQIDHNHDHARGGRTRLDNLSHFCTAHHVLKHPDIDDRHRWTAQQRAGGVIVWRSPLGREYADHPPQRVMFV